MNTPEWLDRILAEVEAIELLPFDERVEAINSIREAIHKVSPFAGEPVDFVRWVKAETVHANDYNPNSVAPPEMELLRVSIMADGYTQPIVTNQSSEGVTEVIDGFHRNRVGRECKDVAERVHGYLPVVQIRLEQTDKADRMAATIRHNRARGKHQVDAMSDIVLDLKRRNWSSEKIGNQLGMDADEVLRLSQIAGLSEVFADQEFSTAWEHDGPVEESIPEDDNDEINLEWMNDVKLLEATPGWHERSEKSSVLYGEKNKHLGMIQKSRFKENEWFGYAYTAPINEFRAGSKEEAMMVLEGIMRFAA